MTIFPFVLDFRPAYLKSGGSSGSLLLAPLGAGSVLTYLQSCISTVSHETLVVLSPTDHSQEYEQAICEAAGKSNEVMVSGDGFRRFAENCEPSDWLLFIDPRFFPLNGYHLGRVVRDLAVNPCARHLVAVEPVPGGTKECVVMNPAGQVCRIQRYYEGVTWVKTSSVSCTLVSAACAYLVQHASVTSLAEFKQALTVAGVPGVDLLPSGSYADLTEEGSLLSLNERFVLHPMSHAPGIAYREKSRDVLVGPRCEIHPGARIHGPVLLQSGVRVEDDVTIVGPTVIGEGTHIQRHATVAQCVVMPHVTIPAKTTTRHRVVTEQSLICLLDNSTPLENPVSMKPPTLLTGRIETHSVSPVGRRVYPRVKRVGDVVMAVILLIILSPLLLLVSVLIKLTSKGPILFGHERECRGGKPFQCWKFRTMVKDAHARQRRLYMRNQVDGPQFKLENDPRIMRLGRVLRVTNIDELPQLINVLRGQMSLIGPRPSPFRENQICIPWRKARLSVRPGITGLWQICRHDRAAGDFHQWIYYDMLYVRHMSLFLDLKILLVTIVTLGGRWSVPLSWLIAERKLQDQTDLRVVAEWSPLMRVLDVR